MGTISVVAIVQVLSFRKPTSLKTRIAHKGSTDNLYSAGASSDPTERMNELSGVRKSVVAKKIYTQQGMARAAKQIRTALNDHSAYIENSPQKRFERGKSTLTVHDPFHSMDKKTDLRETVGRSHDSR